MRYLAEIYVTLKPTVNDPQGQTVLAGLKTLGFDSLRSVRVGKRIEALLDAPSLSDAEEQVQGMCDKLLANPVIEDFSYRLSAVDEGEGPPP